MNLLNTLLSLANPHEAIHSQRFFKTGKGEYGEGDQFLGIRVPVLRKLAKQYLQSSDDEIETLLHNEFHEARLVGLYILVYQFEKASEDRKRAIFTLYLRHLDAVNNWDLVDTSTPHIIGNFLQTHPQESREFLYDFAVSKNLWKRRMAIMATFAFLKQNDFDDTFRITTLLLHDAHDLIHKAVGWMLREVGKKDLNVLLRFLDAHAKKMPRTMLRYAIEKCSSETRNYYLKL